MSVFGTRSYMYMDTVIRDGKRVFFGAPPEVMDWLKRKTLLDRFELEVYQGEFKKIISAQEYYKKNF